MEAKATASYSGVEGLDGAASGGGETNRHNRKGVDVFETQASDNALDGGDVSH